MQTDPALHATDMQEDSSKDSDRLH